jgi:hypothetical protein
MRKIFESVAATVMATAVLAAVTHWSATRADASATWWHVTAWASRHEPVLWFVAASIFALNVAWWVVCATLRRRRGVDVFTGELTMPSMTSVLFTALVISGAIGVSAHLAAGHSLWAVLPGAGAAWLFARAVTSARYRWERFTGML